MKSKKLTIVLDEYNYRCSDGCCYEYGIVTTVNGEELSAHNTDKETILQQILEHLGYEVEIINKFDGEEM
jgi:hypothetical protein